MGKTEHSVSLVWPRSTQTGQAKRINPPCPPFALASPGDERQRVDALPPRLALRHSPQLREPPDRRPGRAPQVRVQRLEERGPLEGVAQVRLVEREEAAGGLPADGVERHGAVGGAVVRVPPLQRLRGLQGRCVAFTRMPSASAARPEGK